MARQSLSFLFTAALLVPFVSPMAFAGAQPADSPIAEVPFKLEHGYMVMVEGAIGELEKVSLLIDTGALVTVIDERIAEKLQLMGTSLSAASLFAENQQVQEVALPDLKIGRAVFPSGSALVTDLSTLGFSRAIDVIVGLDLLKRTSFGIDYESRTFSVGRVRAHESGAQMEKDSPYFTGEFRVLGRPLRLMIDTGADNLILFATQVQNRLGQLKMRRMVALNHIQGTSYAREVELKEVSLGPDNWKRLPAVLLGTDTMAEFNIDGLAATVSLGMKRVQFDFSNHTFSWER